MCNGILYLPLLILPTPRTLWTVKLQLSSALLPSSSYDKSTHRRTYNYNKMQESHDNIVVLLNLKGWITEKRNECVILFLSIYLFPKLAFLILEGS